MAPESLFFFVLGKIPSESKDGERIPQDTTEDISTKEKNIPQQSNIRPQRSFMKPRSLVQPLPSCLTSVPSLNSVLAPIASPEVVRVDEGFEEMTVEGNWASKIVYDIRLACIRSFLGLKIKKFLKLLTG